jgi:Predicted transmembrane transcriptional regulator (anti-sigma factor)
MNEEQQLKLQAFLDGELPEDEAREISAWIAQDEEATALSKELRNTRQALKNSVSPVRLPESREFYWSKIQREIERSERVPVRAVQPSLFERLRRMLIPAAGFALVAAAGVMMFRGMPNGADSEMAVADSGAFTYRDYANGTTLVWVSYPAER